MRRSSAELSSVPRFGHHSSEQIVRKLPADGCPNLRHLLSRTEPVEPRHQGSVQACRDRQSRGRDSRSGVLRRIFAACFQNGPRHLLYKQRYAVRPLNYVLPYRSREQFVANDPVDHGFQLTPGQTTKSDRTYVRLSDPRSVKFRPERHDQQYVQRLYPVHDATKQFDARGVAPMCILEDHQHRV